MFIYNVIFGVNFLLSLVNIYKKETVKKILIISFIMLNIFVCLNYLNGIDWVQYQTNFLKILSFDQILSTQNYYANIPVRNRGELFFYYSMSLFKMFNLNYEIYQYIVLTFAMLLIYKFILKFTEYPLIILLYCFSYFLLEMFMEPILRQLLSMAIFYNALEDFLDKKYKRYFFKIILATLFHISAIILLLMYFIPKKKIEIKYILLLFLLAIDMVKKIEIFLIFLSSYIPIFTKYIYYFTSKDYGFENNINTIFIIKLIISIFIGIFVEKNKKYLKIKNKNKFNFILNLFWLNEFIFILKRQMPIFLRIQMYFEIFYIIFLVFFIKIIIKKYDKKMGIIIFTIFSIFYYRSMYVGINYWNKKDKEKYLPYTNYITEIIFNQDIKENYEKINYRIRYKK